MISLKGYIVGLARHLRMTPAALYERQRALVRAGLLDLESGRGPGSGVRTTTGSVALLLTAVLATDRLAETEQRTQEISTTYPKNRADHRLPPFAKLGTFQDALTSILGAGGVAGVQEVTVSRTASRAVIRYRPRGDGRDSIRDVEFVGPGADEPSLRVSATLSREVLEQIGDDVKALLEADLQEGKKK